MAYGDSISIPGSEPVAEEAVARRQRFRSCVAPGNRQRSYGGSFSTTGGEKRPRLNTTLPVETLSLLDTLATEHRLQRNEVITLALEAIAGVNASPEASSRFAELANRWKGFGKGSCQLAGNKEPGSNFPHE